MQGKIFVTFYIQEFGRLSRKIIYAFEYIKIYIRQNITDNLSVTLVVDNQLFIDVNVNTKKDNNKKSYPKSVVFNKKSYPKSVVYYRKSYQKSV